MYKKYRVGILGATGTVGQNYIKLLENHPWFEVSYLAASENSAGKRYSEAVGSKWFMDTDIPFNVRYLMVHDANKLEDAIGKCDFLFSSYDGSKEEIRGTEMAYAQLGFGVVSNNSAHRWTRDVPMIIPEINHLDIDLINQQRVNRGFAVGGGFVITKPNCSIQSYLTPIYALMQKGYDPKKIIVTTQQALSGAGYPGVPSLAIMNNVIPYIDGEEEKTEKEPLKILQFMSSNDEFIHKLRISATCTRVPVIDGHTAIMSVEFGDKKPKSLKEIISIWRNFKSKPQELNLPSAPQNPIIYREEEDRPQPRKDINNGNGMAVTVGRLRHSDVLDFKFVGLSHNTNRGAAGGAILSAELLVSQGYIGFKY